MELISSTFVWANEMRSLLRRMNFGKRQTNLALGAHILAYYSLVELRFKL
jgi:hypothetical protein